MAKLGLWNIGGYNLPDFGISEKLGLSKVGVPNNPAYAPNATGLSSGAQYNQYSQPAQVPQINYGANALSATGYNQGLQSGALSGGSPIPTPPSVQGAQTSGGGGGGSEYDRVKQEMLKGQRTWDDNLLASLQQQGGDPYAEQRRIAEEQARLELENSLREYDRTAEETVAQRGQLEQQQKSLLSGFETERGKAKTQAETSTKQAEQTTRQAQSKALSTAQGVERQNRNVLRALGILSSSAAGEMLAKPYGVYQTVAADLQQSFVNRKGEIDQWMRDRGTEIDQAVNQVNTQFTNLIGQINRDMRFSGEQRAAAVQQAQNALRQTMNDINTKAQAYQQAANQYTSKMLQQIAQIQLYQNPQADVSGILGSAINVTNPAYGRQQTAIYQGEDKKKLSG